MNEAIPTPAPIHDIVGPIWFSPYPLWMIITFAIAALVLLGLIAWKIKKSLSQKRVLSHKERALAELESLRDSVAGAKPYAFGIAVSDVLRTYIHAQHGLRATTQTSLEFLEHIRRNTVFSDNEKAGLSVFLEKTDLLKYARAEASNSDMIGLLETAGRLVRGEVQPEKGKGAKS